MNTAHKSGIAAIVLATAFLVLYTGLNTRFQWQFSEHQGFLTYDMLARAWSIGQLHLDMEVDPRRIASGDPLNPKLPYPFQFDAIIWHGKYYIHHEPLPALFHLAWTTITGLPFKTGYAVVMFGFLNSILFGILLKSLRANWFPETPSWIAWFFWISFSMSGFQLYMVGRPVIYNEAILAGNFFILLGLIIFNHFLFLNPTRIILAFLCGFSFGAAVLCRLPLALFPLLLPASFLICSLIRREGNFPKWDQTLAFALPLCASFLFLLGYNYARFEAFLDFGRTHVIFPDFDMYLYLAKLNNFFHMAHLPIQAYNYFAMLPNLSDRFPFVFLPHYKLLSGNVITFNEFMISIFLITPMLLTMVTVLGVGKNQLYSRKELNLFLLFCALAGSAVLSSLLLYVWAVPRFAYDFVHVYIITGFCCTALVWVKFTEDSLRRGLFSISLFILFVFNGIMGAVLALHAMSY